jgi:hypothetical protein
MPIAYVVRQTSSEYTYGHKRMVAAFVLQAHSTDDRYLKELYWLAVNKLLSDASGEYRDSIH